MIGMEIEVKMMQTATNASNTALIRLLGMITSRSTPCAPMTVWFGIFRPDGAVEVIPTLYRMEETASTKRDARAAPASLKRDARDVRVVRSDDAGPRRIASRPHRHRRFAESRAGATAADTWQV